MTWSRWWRLKRLKTTLLLEKMNERLTLTLTKRKKKTRRRSPVLIVRRISLIAVDGARRQ